MSYFKHLVRILSVSILLSVSFEVKSEEYIPFNAYQYKSKLMRYSQYTFGINAPTSLFAAQIHKESTWNPRARSPYADGLTQFTPQTVEFVSKKFPALIKAEPFNPVWAIQAMLLYDNWLKNRITYWPSGPETLVECDDWAFALSAYNGGYGWVIRDRKLTRTNDYDHNVWIDNVEKFSNRSKRAITENRGYPKKILGELYTLYYNDGWGGPKTICETDTRQQLGEH